MKMELAIRESVSRDFLRMLLDVAVEMELPASIIRLTPDGLFIPLDVAERAGLLEEFKNCPEPEKVEVVDDKPKRTPAKRAGTTGRKSQRTPAEAPAEPEESPVEDPWL